MKQGGGGYYGAVAEAFMNERALCWKVLAASTRKVIEDVLRPTA